MFGPGVDAAIEKYSAPDRELLAVLQLFGKDHRICFRYEIKEGPKVFETEVRGKKFELYNGSKIRSAVESRGGQSLNFPDLADRVSDDLYSKRLSIAKALKELPIGNRAELSRWQGEVKKTLGAVIHD